MSRGGTRYSFDTSTPSPCDGCRHEKLCGTKYLACERYAVYVGCRDDLMSKAETKPHRIYYLLGVLGHLNGEYEEIFDVARRYGVTARRIWIDAVQRNIPPAIRLRFGTKRMIFFPIMEDTAGG